MRVSNVNQISANSYVTKISNRGAEKAPVAQLGVWRLRNGGVTMTWWETRALHDEQLQPTHVTIFSLN
jgi:hypothetical protein